MDYQIENRSSQDPYLSTNDAVDDDGWDELFRLKYIEFDDVFIPILTQNLNGPCPLIAIANVLLLSKKITLSLGKEFVHMNEILNILSDYLFNSSFDNLSEAEMANNAMNMSDAYEIFPQIKTGLDVNIKFTSVSSFEVTPELLLFDVFNIFLCHGWIVDQSDQELIGVVGDSGYNQFTAKLTMFKESEDVEEQRKAEIGQRFLSTTSSQLTDAGLVQLNERLREHELAVLFRNNHFHTLYKHENRLYTLLTDLGYANEVACVWETFTTVDGNEMLVNSHFNIPKDLIVGDSVIKSLESTVGNGHNKNAITESNQAIEPKLDASGATAQKRPLSADCPTTNSDYELASQLQKFTLNDNVCANDLKLAQRMQDTEYNAIPTRKTNTPAEKSLLTSAIGNSEQESRNSADPLSGGGLTTETLCESQTTTAAAAATTTHFDQRATTCTDRSNKKKKSLKQATTKPVPSEKPLNETQSQIVINLPSTEELSNSTKHSHDKIQIVSDLMKTEDWLNPWIKIFEDEELEAVKMSIYRYLRRMRYKH